MNFFFLLPFLLLILSVVGCKDKKDPSEPELLPASESRANWAEGKFIPDTESIQNVIGSADSIKVTENKKIRISKVTGKRIRERKIYHEKDPEAVKHVISNFRINTEECSGWLCRCGGEVILEFYKKDELLAKLTLHHGHSLKWLDSRWRGSGIMYFRNAKAVCGWLIEIGFDDPKRMLKHTFKNKF